MKKYILYIVLSIESFFILGMILHAKMILTVVNEGILHRANIYTSIALSIYIISTGLLIYEVIGNNKRK